VWTGWWPSIVLWLKARSVEPEVTAVARVGPINTFPPQKQESNNRGNLGGSVFCAVSAEAWLEAARRQWPRTPRVEAVSNTSIVTLRVVGGEEKGTQCLGV
jgi:hypothetical protein